MDSLSSLRWAKPGIQAGLSTLYVTITTKTGDVTELRRLVRARVEMMQAMRAYMARAKPEAK